MLRSGLEFLACEGAVNVCGSIFLPSAALLAKQRARPWAGVYLSEEFLGSVEGANDITRKVLLLFKEFGVSPLVESAVENAEAVTALKSLLAGTIDRTVSHCDRRWGRRMKMHEPGAVSDVDDHSLLEKFSQLSAGERNTADCQVARTHVEPTPADKGGHAKTQDANSHHGCAIVWFRQDLRIHDNPALVEAARRHEVVIPVFVWAPEDEGSAPPGGASQIWIREALRSLAGALQQLGSQLVLRRSTSYATALSELVQETRASAVYCCRRYEPWTQRVDGHVGQRLSAVGARLHDLPGYLLYEPARIAVENGYTSGHWGTLMPFYRACLSTGKPRRPLPSPPRLSPHKVVRTVDVDRLGLDNGVSPGGEEWGRSIRKAWPEISETAALRRLQSFVRGKSGLQSYEKQRSRADLPENPNSMLSAYLRWGQLSAHDLYWAVEDAGLPRELTKTFGRRLFWRDLAYFQLHHFPDMRTKAIRVHYDAARWSNDKRLLRCWQRGLTGYPLVDASMRELKATGWSQQNMRMVAASFLTEFLNISWVEGAKWYEDQLVDADLAINSMMWQNAGRSGIDQWNFLIYPVGSSQDPTGAYVRKWIPELAGLPTKFVHSPWEAPSGLLSSNGVHLGVTYPNRCIKDLAAARQEAKRATLDMRRGIAATWMNDRDGYDVIALPDGSTTKVFTKQEYRLSKSGVANPSPASKGKGARKGQGRGRGTDDPSDRPTKFPRNGQTTLDTFVESPQKRWRQLKGAPVLEVIDIDDPCWAG